MIETTFLCLCACLWLAVAAEFLARRFIFNPNQTYIRKPGSWGTFQPSEGTPGITKDAVVCINRHGLRGRSSGPWDSWRVLVLGGSTTEDNLLNDGEMWTGRLETRLQRQVKRAWVGNAGRSGCNARHHAMQLARLLPTWPRPDLILVLCGLNDLLFDFRLHHPFDVGQNWDERAAFGYIAPDKLKIALWEIARNRKEPGVFPLGDQIGAFKARRAQVQKGDWVTALPNMDVMLTKYRAELCLMADAARSHGSRIAFITQPALWKAEMTPEEDAHCFAGGVNSPGTWNANPRAPWFTAPLLGQMLTRYNDTMREFCRDEGLPCIDLAAELPRTRAHFIDDFHFSTFGTGAVSGIVERGILDNGLAPETARANVKQFGASIYPTW